LIVEDLPEGAEGEIRFGDAIVGLSKTVDFKV